MNVILSVKPEYASKILAGEKLYEYRKVIFRQPVEKVFIYASSPISMIVGVTQAFFNRYFKGKPVGYAIRMKEVVAYAVPISPFRLREDFKAPQSFIYIE